MTVEEFKALPVGALVSLDGEVGEIVRKTSEHLEIFWPDSSLNVYTGFTKGWEGFINDLEEEG